MTLTAQEHQKIAALQQIANLVGQAQSVAGNQQVLANIIEPSLNLAVKFERSDPEFQELAIWLRRAKVDPAPHVLSNLAGQAQRMLAIIRTGLPHRTDPQYGLKMVWDPLKGNVTSPAFEEDEPLTLNTAYDWRGSKRFPFGLPIPIWNSFDSIDNFSDESSKTVKSIILSIIAGTLAGVATDQLTYKTQHSLLKELSVPAAASIISFIIYWAI